MDWIDSERWINEWTWLVKTHLTQCLMAGSCPSHQCPSIFSFVATSAISLTIQPWKQNSPMWNLQTCQTGLLTPWTHPAHLWRLMCMECSPLPLLFHTYLRLTHLQHPTQYSPSTKALLSHWRSQKHPPGLSHRALVPMTWQLLYTTLWGGGERGAIYFVNAPFTQLHH